MNWYNVWQQQHLFDVENNVIKKNQLIFTPFIKTIENGFLNANFRANLYVDSLARYYRFKNLNVLANPGFYTINSNENRTKAINYYKTYLDELIKLNCGYINNRLVVNNSYDSLKLIQQIFLYLYDKGYVEYKEIPLFKDEYNTYDQMQIDNKYRLKNDYAFTLNITKHLKTIINIIDNLSIKDEYKDKIYKALGEYTTLELELNTSNDKKINLFLEAPEELGALGAIVISPNYIDILEYIAPWEISSVENFLFRKNKPYLYSGNFIINPLTGKEVPIFISFKYDMPIKTLFSTTDLADFNYFDINPINIYNGNYLCNSDFLDGLTKEDARIKIVEMFSEEGMAQKTYNYEKKEIVISSFNNYLFPIPLEKNTLKPLSKAIPIYYDEFKHLKFNNDNNCELVDYSFNDLFMRGIEIILNILNDNLADVGDVFSKTNLMILEKYLNNLTLVINKKEILETLLMPIIILSIISDNENIKIFKNLEIKIYDNVYDLYGNDIKKSSNNCIKVLDLLANYGADSVRLYYLSIGLEDKIYFDENKIFYYKQILNKIRACFMKGFLASNFDLEFPFYQLKNKLFDDLVSLDLDKYIKDIFEFFKEYIENKQLTKKQASDFLILLSIVCPNLAEDLNYEFLNKRELILNLSWII